jgi:5-formyltetrahydrofolate cyclo-ligase
MAEKGRWAGRNETKDLVREDVWKTLRISGVAVGPAWSNIPNFVGADMAAFRLAQTPEWQAARTVKCNPDPPQIPVRLRALYDGKMLFAPVPYLTKKFPYIRLDPAKLKAKGIDFETAATAQGYLQHGEPVEFEDVYPLDFCVVGSVAVTRSGGRTGKGAGFADLETGIFRELGIIRPDTPMATTVHSSQLVDEPRVVMQGHDSPLDYVATEEELIVTGNRDPRPSGVAWDAVQPDQFEQIPFLTELRDRFLARAGGR